MSLRASDDHDDGDAGDAGDDVCEEDWDKDENEEENAHRSPRS